MTSTSTTPSEPEPPPPPRKLLLEGEAVREDEVGGFTSWECEDAYDGGPVVVEVGFFDEEDRLGLGFVLFDGSDRGSYAYYERAGLDHEWQWDEYILVIKTDGTGLYYDFRGVPEGGSTEPSAVYECSPK